MQKNIDLIRFCRLERCLKPHDLAVHYFFIMLNALAFLIEPAARSAYGNSSVRKARVVQHVNVLYVIFLKKLRALVAVVHQ